MGKFNQIPIRSLQERGKSTFEINRIEPEMLNLNALPSAAEHRDDYFVFIYNAKGENTITVDFQDIKLSDNTIFCIRPGQIHFGNFASDTSAWIISAAAEWVPADFRVSLAKSNIWKFPLGITADDNIAIFQKALSLLYKFETQNDIYIKEAAKPMFDVCLQLFIQILKQASDYTSQVISRPALIAQQFYSLLLSSFRIMKTPSEYAACLNITPAYLNEVIKEATGLPVSHCIHQEIILEAKRTLFYTHNSAKEIAHALGYSDSAYFIRLFKKVTGITPLQFRNKYRR